MYDQLDPEIFSQIIYKQGVPVRGTLKANRKLVDKLTSD